MKHDYTNELELKSLLIRIKNTRLADGTTKTSQTNVRSDEETIQKTYVTHYDSSIPNACKYCSNHPSNGGSGICHCTLCVPQITC